MSDVDDSDFDKEAERERLREKYERDREDREAAQQMSDLLLKGATMTNSHCGTCGSPIFRVDGQEFCPSCSAEAAHAAEQTEREQPRDAIAEEPSPDERLGDVVAGDDADDSESTSTVGTSIAERAAASVQSAQRRDPPSQTGDDSSGRDVDRPADPRESTTPNAPPAPDDASLADAQQSLLNAITHHARAATDADPRTARDHLEAASEAAEALAEISQ